MIRSALAWAFLAASCLAGCTADKPSPEYVARVGNEVFYREDLERSLAGYRAALDSADASRQVVDQWVTTRLLYDEAVRRGLRSEPDVRRQLVDAEQSVLVNSLVERAYADAAPEPTASEVQAYFERNRDRLRLLEAFVRVRYLPLANADSARVAARLLAASDTSDQSSWFDLVERFSTNPDASRSLSITYVAESRLFSEFPVLRQRAASIRPGATTPVVSDGGSLHVIQIVDRVAAGAVPQIAWIEASLREQLQIESRKQLYARLVQRLRNEAVAREQLDVPEIQN